MPTDFALPLPFNALGAVILLGFGPLALSEAGAAAANCTGNEVEVETHHRHSSLIQHHRHQLRSIHRHPHQRAKPRLNHNSIFTSIAALSTLNGGESGHDRGDERRQQRHEVTLLNAPHTYITTVVGLERRAGNVDGQAAEAQVMSVRGMGISPITGELYFTDFDNCCIKKLTGNGQVVPVAGDGDLGYIDGPASSGQFWFPVGLSFAPNGDLFVADVFNHRVRKLSTAGELTTVAGGGPVTGKWNEWGRVSHGGLIDGPSATMRFNFPYGVVFDHVNGGLYVTDPNNAVIRRVSPDFQEVTTIAGGSKFFVDGFGTDASFGAPEGCVVDSRGNLYVSDPCGYFVREKHRIRRITPAGEVTTLAGSPFNYGGKDGMGTCAKFFGIQGLAIDGLDNIYAAERLNHRIRRISPNGRVQTLLGKRMEKGEKDGPATAALCDAPYSVAVERNSGKLFFSEPIRHRIRMMRPLLRRETPFDEEKPAELIPSNLSSSEATATVSQSQQNLNIFTHLHPLSAPEIISPSTKVDRGDVNTLHQVNYQKFKDRGGRGGREGGRGRGTGRGGRDNRAIEDVREKVRMLFSNTKFDEMEDKDDL